MSDWIFLNFGMADISCPDLLFDELLYKLSDFKQQHM